MAGRYDPTDYETVEDRLRAFWADHPNGRIETDLFFSDDKHFIFKASVYFGADDQWPKSTGFADETVGTSTVNRTNALENCETSAIGRALANCNYAARGKRPSREEMEKANRPPPPSPAVLARDTLRATAKQMGADLNKLVAVYEHMHGVALGQDDNASRIESFHQLLKVDMIGLLDKEVT